jgi:zinc and cadmium transporter
MSAAWELPLYSSVIVFGALLGGVVPLATSRLGWLQTLSALSAGVMFGAVGFLLMPEAVHSVGPWAWALVPIGFSTLWVLERLLHRWPGAAVHAAAGRAGLGVIGASALFGFSAHTVLDGVALASAVQSGVGGSACLVILAHKVPSSMSLAVLLRTDERPMRTVVAALLFYGMMVPLGAGLYAGLNALIHLERMAAWAMAFSAGTFVYIAGVELLPRVLRDGGRRRFGNLGAVVMGAGLMAWVARLARELHP